MTEKVTEIKDRKVDWDRLGEVRHLVSELPAEERVQGARLNARYWALYAAVKELKGEQSIASEHYREHTVEVLEGLRAEISAEFGAWQEARGIPEL